MLMLMFELLGDAAMAEETEVGITLPAQAMAHPQLLTLQALLICFSDEAGQSPTRELPAWVRDCRCGQPARGCAAPQARRAQPLPPFLAWAHQKAFSQHPAQIFVLLHLSSAFGAR